MNTRLGPAGPLPRLSLVLGLFLATLAVFLYTSNAGVERAAIAACVEGEDCQAEIYPPGMTAEEKLAWRHAPIAFVADHVPGCDTLRANFEPVPVDIVLDNPSIALRKQSDPGFAIYAPTAADMYIEGRDKHFDAYIDMPGNPRWPGCRYLRDAIEFSEGHANVAYARVASEQGFDGFVLQYWLFYYFNQWNNKHEADWELIQLYFKAGSPEEALTQDPAVIALSQHSVGEVAAWSDPKVRKLGDRPFVYVATGSNANYFTPRVFLGRGEDGRGVGCDDASHSTRPLLLDAVLLPDRISGPNDPFAWVAFKGHWGEHAGPEFEGSTAPITKEQWQKPLSWQSRLRSSSVYLPLGETVGPDAVRAFCGVVSFGSGTLLPFYRDLPLVAALAFGLISVGTLASLTRTRYAPIIAYPLRCRRRVGQILTSALEIYRGRSSVFLSLGLLALPVGLLISMLSRQGLRLPVPSFVSLPGGDATRELLYVIALSELHFGLVYALVIAATTVALAAIDKNRPVNTADALRQLARSLPQLLLARLIAIATIMFLVLTVLGIPLAIRQAVRWSFLEQAVLLDGKPARQAFGESARAVEGRWWWTAAIVLPLGFFAIAFASFLGIAMVLALKSVPLVYLNLITAAVYVALVPYIAIVLSLVYFDLHGRRAGQSR